MSTTKPTIVLIPGAWHSPAHYEKLFIALKESGYEVQSTKLPSVGSSEPEKATTANNVDHIREKLLDPLVDAGKDILLMMHSYGGCPGSGAAKGYSKSEMAARGKKGGVIGLVFLAAMVVQEGESIKALIPGGKFDPWVTLDADGNAGQLGTTNPKEVFYHDATDEDARHAISLLQYQSEASLTSAISAPAWADPAFDGKRVYFLLDQDKTIPVFVQEIWLQHSGVEWETERLPTSHSPFLSEPRLLADKVIEYAKKYSS